MKRKNIFIVELNYHYFCLETIISLVLNKPSERYSYYVVTTDKIYNKFNINFKNKLNSAKNIDINIIKSSDNDTKNIVFKFIQFYKISKTFVTYINKNARRGDILIMNTIDQFRLIVRFIIFKKIKKLGLNVVAGMHNIHEYFPNIIKDDEISDIKEYYYKKYEKFFIFGRNKIQKLIIDLFVWLNSKVIINKFIDNVAGLLFFGKDLSLPKKNNNLVIPSKLANETLIKRRLEYFSNDDKKQEIIFTVVGEVSSKRKDYNFIIKSFERLKPNNFRLILLGKITDENIRNIINSSSVKDRITYFEEFVDDELFEEWLVKTNYMIIPIKNIPPYGKYKLSGSVNDAFAFSIPIIINREYFKDKIYLDNVELFDDKLDGILEKVVNSNYKNVLSASIKYALKNFSREQYAQEFVKFMNGLQKF